MKMKKVKLLLRAINTMAKRKPQEIKGFVNTHRELSPGHPLILLPTKGKYMLPEVKIINKIIMAIEPKDLIDEARKVNLQTGMLLISAIKRSDSTILALVHTPYGCCAYDAFIEKEFLKEIKEKLPEVKVEIDDDLKDRFEIL